VIHMRQRRDPSHAALDERIEGRRLHTAGEGSHTHTPRSHQLESRQPVSPRTEVRSRCVGRPAVRTTAREPTRKSTLARHISSTNPADSRLEGLGNARFGCYGFGLGLTLKYPATTPANAMR
jgi:hypothetical protein